MKCRGRSRAKSKLRLFEICHMAVAIDDGHDGRYKDTECDPTGA